jgi:Transposase DDE domain group 1
VNIIIRSWLKKCKRRIEDRLKESRGKVTFSPEFSASNIHYQVAERGGGIAYGGIGAIHLLAKRIGLVDAIDRRLHLLAFHMPYQESDHVLNIAYNALCGGTCLQDIELRRNDENYLNALGARTIPDPTTSGDFCRRFTRGHLDTFIDITNEVRLKVWQQQPKEFFNCAQLDMDGTMVETTGECKLGMDIAHDGKWGYHPFVLTFANTGEVLSIVNRSGNRPSHEGAAPQVDRAIELCDKAGFRKIVLRGDTDFSQTRHLDRWDSNPRVRFFFGIDAMPNLREMADNLPKTEWQPLKRPARYQVKTSPRGRRAKVKEQVVKEREFENKRLCSEDVADLCYKPGACRETYRLIVLRKNISVEKGEQVLFPDHRYFFYITNEHDCTAAEVIFQANDRCNQENHLAQLKSGVPALHAPVDNLESNWAYMLMMALAWNLKAWWALTLPETPGRTYAKQRADKRWVLKLEFKTFLNAFMRLPCQIVNTGRKLVYRLLGWNPHLPIFFRLLDVLRC